MQAHYGKRYGFTIWEALFIVFIILIVAAVIFPIFARTGYHEGGGSNCQNNLKSLAVALLLYMEDNDNQMPSSALVNHSKKWNRKDFLKFTSETGELPSKSRPQTYAQVLYDHMKNKDILFCPSDPAYEGTGDRPVSYWWKLAVDKAWYGEGCKKVCRNEADFAYNADQIVLYERKGWHFQELDGLKNGVQINVAYMDSHVRTICLCNSGDNPINTPAPKAGEPAYFNCEYAADGVTHKPLPEGKPAGYVDPSRYWDKL